MKKTLWTMAAALALVGCSESELLDTPQALEQNAITFDTYVGDNAQTRAAVIDRGVLGVKGFGVNAYYTGISTFSEATAEDYDGKFEYFMENTKVTLNPDKGDNGVWEYSPVKYWPNNAGDKVSFFAYGPYANNGNANNIELDGTDINFTVNNDVKLQVDLVYSNQEGENSTIDKSKQAVNERIHFKFDHALARIAFTVEAAVDEATASDNLLDGNTRINVKKVVLMEDSETADPANPTGPFYTTGTLSLVDGGWTLTEEEKEKLQGFTFDGGENGDGSDSEFYHTVKDMCAETGNEVNVVQLTRFNASKQQRLLNDDSYLMVIPQEAAKFKIYIEYDVISEGYDNDNTGIYDESAIVNKITSAKALEVDFEAGKAYNFNLVLGMTSVKFEVDEVANWDDATDYEDEEWLPENIPFITEVDEEGNTWFLIQSAGELATFRSLINQGETYIDEDGTEKKYCYGNYKQTADINLDESLFYTNAHGGLCWEPIGVGSRDTDGTPHIFGGTYDGQGYTVSNVNHDRNYMSGLFYKLEDGATIKNLRVEGTITDSWAYCTGGIVGESSNVTIINCHFTGSIHGSNTYGRYPTNIGGVAGNNSGTITACSSSATINGTGSTNVGGIVGNGKDVQACYNYDAVTGNSNVGGIAGKTSGAVVGCYNIASANIVGSGSSISYSYYTNETSGISGYHANNSTVVTVDNWAIAGAYMNYGLNNASVSYHYEATSAGSSYPLALAAGSVEGTQPPASEEAENTENGSEEEGEEDAGADEGDGTGTESEKE